MRKTVLYVIDDLGRGGAETLLVGILPNLQQHYDVILVTLSDNCEFDSEELTTKHNYSLGFKGKTSFVPCIFRLKKIIRKHKPDLIHSHLVNSSIVVRMAAPRSVPVLCSLHSQLSRNVYEGSWTYRNVEKRLFNKDHIVIAVSREVLDDYQTAIGTPNHGIVLHNYIADDFFQSSVQARITKQASPLKFVAVGNIKKVKNYEFLIQAFSLLKDEQVSLDVYGKGEELYVQQLKKAAMAGEAKVSFRGQANHVNQLLPAYDIYIMASLHEGFGIAAVEAMAVGLPVLLSDLPVLREVTRNNALFFDLTDPAQLATIVRDILARRIDTKPLVEKGMETARGYSKEKYVDGLVSIYNNFVVNQS